MVGQNSVAQRTQQSVVSCNLVGDHILAAGWAGLHILAAEGVGDHALVGVVLLHTAAVQVEVQTLLAEVVHIPAVAGHTPGVDGVDGVEMGIHNTVVADLKITSKLFTL